MKKIEKLVFCELPETPHEFNIEKFKAKEEMQIKLYNDTKRPRRKKLLTYAQVTDKDKIVNYARVVPKDGIFLDFDNPEEAEEMYEIITRAKSNCLILETTKGYHFLFRKPDFYKKEMTRATNWFGYKFDCKATTDEKEAVQIMRVCGMDRKEVFSWDLDTPITLDTINMEKLDVLPFWLWGKLSDKDLHKKGKTGDRDEPTHDDYTLTDNPFTQLMTMTEGSRHNHIVERCSYFGLSNGFTESEFRDLISAIHDQYMVKIGPAMPDSDLFGDLDTRWEEYKDMLEREKWTYEEKDRKWIKVKKKKEEKIDERRAAEYLYSQYDFYGISPRTDGTFTSFLYRDPDGEYNYKSNVTKLRKMLKDYSDQNFKESFLKEVEVQLMQMCAENNKIISRTDKYVIAKNKILSCITADSYDFSWLGTRPPTDVVLPFNWYSQEWVDEHKDDLGGLITKFIRELSRDASGKPQPEVEQWLYVIAGASMMPNNQLQKIVVMAGGGQNGKSLYTSLIRLCLGADMFNTSKIFSSSPTDSFWGKDLDKGILCVVDDLPRRYNRDAFSYIKGAITGTDTVEINEKFKPKRRLPVLPQIIACTNFEFELYDTSDGMKRRLLLLPTEFHVDDDIKDGDLQHKLVLNTTSSEAVIKYKMSADAFGHNTEKIMNMYPDEKGVLDSLDNGSLAWFANKCRYDYIKWLLGEIKLSNTEEMESLLEDTFKNNPEIQCTKFIKMYLTSKGWHINKANCFFSELYKEYKNFCKTEGLNIMGDKKFSITIKKLGCIIKNKRKNKGDPYRFVYFDKCVVVLEK